MGEQPPGEVLVVGHVLAAEPQVEDRAEPGGVAADLALAAVAVAVLEVL